MGLFGRDERRPSETSTTLATTGSPPPAGPVKSGPEATTIAKSCTVEGSINGSGDILIHGAFKGEIECAASLIIAQSGKVEAQLSARSITVAGSVEGDLFAKDKIELKPSAHLLGNITAPKILIQEGATFEGQVFMKDPGQPASKPGKPATPGSGQAKPPASSPSSAADKAPASGKAASTAPRSTGSSAAAKDSKKTSSPSTSATSRSAKR